MKKIYVVFEWCGDCCEMIYAFESFIEAQRYAFLKNKVCSLGLHYNVDEVKLFSNEYVESIKNGEIFVKEDRDITI